MRIGIEEKDKDIYRTLQILNSYTNEEVKLEEVLIQMISKDISSSDLLFLILQRLRRDGYLNGERGVLKILNKISDTEIEKISSEINAGIRRNRKLFVTPLEIAKFFTCPRRLFLEKIVLSRQFKEDTGKTWDGETIHLAINLFIKNFGKKEIEELISEVVSQTVERYKDKITLNEERIKEFILNFYRLVEKENFSKIFTEKNFESFKIGLTGTPDLIGIKESGEIIPIDIKLGSLDRRGVKEEHLLQSVGEAILIEDFFRKKVNYSYLIYFGSNSLVKIDLNEERRRKVISHKRRIERIGKSSYVPEKSFLRNSKMRICAGCHVKPACDNIEDLRRIYY